MIDTITPISRNSAKLSMKENRETIQRVILLAVWLKSVGVPMRSECLLRGLYICAEGQAGKCIQY